MKHLFLNRNQQTIALAMVVCIALAGCKKVDNNVSTIPSDAYKYTGAELKTYFSAESGMLTLSTQASVLSYDSALTENNLINIYPAIKYQEIIGFGSAFTETAAYNYAQLSEDKRKEVIDAFFDREKGIGMNFCRTTIHSADFSVDEYTYVEDNDTTLSTFSIDRDTLYVLPFVKAALAKNPDIKLFASPWSPPAWMKDNKSMIQGGKLLPEYYDLWAQYMTRYLSEYKNQGVEFFAMSVQNEPKAVQTWESCIYSGEDEGVFVTKNLKPNLKKAGFDDLKILIWDHNKERVVDRALETFAVPGAKDDIWGIGFHWYSGEHFDNLRMAHELFPDKPLILTEFCRGDNNSAPKDQSHGMPLPTWDDFEAYANELIGDFNNYTSAACDWNMIVDMNGGPYHNRTGGVKAPIFVDKDNDRYILTACYYAIGHFSKYVKPGAHRIGNSVSFRYEGKDVQLPVSTFQNPDGEIVVVILNRNNFICNPLIKIGDDTAPLSIPAKSLITVVIPPVK